MPIWATMMPMLAKAAPARPPGEVDHVSTGGQDSDERILYSKEEKKD